MYSTSVQAQNHHSLDWQGSPVLAFPAVPHPSNKLIFGHNNYTASLAFTNLRGSLFTPQKLRLYITHYSNNLPTYSGVPMISLSSSLLFIILERPKSTILMSPRGDLLVSRIFWGCKTKGDFQDHPNIMSMTPQCIMLLDHE